MSIVTFYNCDPGEAPKTTRPAHLGANAILFWQDRLLLEQRRDNGSWGLIGGGCRRKETGRQTIAREVWEELGLRIAPQEFEKLAVYDNPGRIAAYRDGSIWRMVIVVYGYRFSREPVLRCSAESRRLGFFTREQLAQLDIAVTHRDIIRDWFCNVGEEANAAGNG